MKILACFLFLITLGISYGKNKVLTSIQPLYSIARKITQNTDIEVKSVFGSDVSMDYGKSAFDDKDFRLSEAKEAKAVITISRVWEQDYLYEYARRENIRIIEIDASYSFSDNSSLSLSLMEDENGGINPYVWLSPSNGIKMAEIISRDLIRLFPENKKAIENNLNSFTLAMQQDIQNKFLSETAKKRNMAVISLSRSFSYLFNDLNIDAEYIPFHEMDSDNVKKLLKSGTAKVIVSDRWLKKEIISEIESNGGKFIVLHTFNIPIDLNDNMDPEGYMKGMKENMNKLIENLE